jgi:hypothetical protein
MSETAGHVEVSELTSIGRRGPELQGMWQRVDARPAPCLDLNLVCRGTRSAGYRQRPPGPPRERLRTRRWGQFFGALSVILTFYSAVNGGPPGGAEAEDPGAPTINAKKRVDGGPPGGAGAGDPEVGDVDGEPWEVLAAGPTAAITKVEDIDGRSPGGCCRQV